MELLTTSVKYTCYSLLTHLMPNLVSFQKVMLLLLHLVWLADWNEPVMWYNVINHYSVHLSQSLVLCKMWLDCAAEVLVSLLELIVPMFFSLFVVCSYQWTVQHGCDDEISKNKYEITIIIKSHLGLNFTFPDKSYFLILICTVESLVSDHLGNLKKWS